MTSNKEAIAASRPLVSIVTCIKGDYADFDRTAVSIYNLGEISGLLEWVVWDVTTVPREIKVPQTQLVPLIYYGTDRGLYDGLNKAIRLTTGLYIIIINSGDCLLATFINEIKKISDLVCDKEGARLPDVFAHPVMTWKKKIIRPVSDLSSFIHQGLIYRRDLHDRYGPYLEYPNFTASDYLFFSGQIDHKNIVVECRTQPIAFYNRPGISATSKHFIQRDLFYGSRCKLSSFRIVHSMIKSIFRFQIGRIYNSVFWRDSSDC